MLSKVANQPKMHMKNAKVQTEAELQKSAKMQFEDRGEPRTKAIAQRQPGLCQRS